MVIIEELDPEYYYKLFKKVLLIIKYYYLKIYL